MTAEKRSIVLTIRTRIDQNSRVLDILEARGERACRKFFHPCLMLAEPDLYQRIKTYVGSVNEHIQDSRRQLIGYLLERDNEGMDQLKNQTVTQKIAAIRSIKEAKRYKIEKAGRKNMLLGKEDNKPAESKSENLIHMTAANGEVELLEELLGDTDINTVNTSNETLLHADNVGHTALHKAASRGHTDIMRVLIKAGVNAVNQDGLTPLHVAGQQGHADTVIQLLQGKADPKVKDRQGRTALHWAAASQEESRVVDLLLSAKTNPNITDNEKKTALHVAAAAGKVDAVTSLLSHKAKAGTRDMDGSTPLHYAAADAHLVFMSYVFPVRPSKKRPK
uniref:Uncharacterized protein n=1 Tax=Amphiprion percula TaxID=161767 RepID=A0A3P8SVP2_AMPPE